MLESISEEYNSCSDQTVKMTGFTRLGYKPVSKNVSLSDRLYEGRAKKFEDFLNNFYNWRPIVFVFSQV